MVDSRKDSPGSRDRAYQDAIERAAYGRFAGPDPAF